jgi:hypothetical protein
MIVKEWRSPDVLPFSDRISLKTGFEAQGMESVLRLEGRRSEKTMRNTSVITTKYLKSRKI